MKYKKMIAIIAVTSVISTSMIGCSKVQDSKATTSTLTLEYNIDKKEDKDLDIDSLDFYLGETILTDQIGRNIKLPIRGTMAIPKKDGKYPVVIIGHGSHGGSSNDRFDDGFKYLVDAIAKQGYVVVSMDIQKQFSLDDGEPQGIERLEAIYKEHISKLKQANQGEDVGYNINLKEKIDLDNIVFIGHSRSGQDMLLLADRLKQQNDESVKGMISIAPANVVYISKTGDEGRPPSKEYYADIPTGFIIPEYDGDVSNLDGLTIYDNILNQDTQRKSPMSAVLLKGGKHNFFNTNLKEDTTFLEPGLVIVNKLNEEQHRDFLVNYSIDFLNSVIERDNKNTIFDLSSPTPNEMYGYKVVTKLNVPESKSVDLVDVKNAKSISSDNIDVEATVEHWIPDKDKVEIFRDPRLGEPIDLLSLTWKEKGSTATIDVSSSGNFKNYEALSIELTQNPTNKSNKTDINQGFTVVLKDKKGKESKVIVGQDTTVLEYIPGKVNKIGEELSFYSNYTPLGELRIPISYFKDIDLNNIVSLSFVFDQTDSGNILVEDVKLK